MNVVIGNKLSFNGGIKMGLVTLLKEKIEESIEKNKAIVVSISSPFIECRKTVYTDDFEVEDQELCLINGNFELHVNLDDNAQIIYNDNFDDKFMIVNKDIETTLYFLH